jgi:glycosyltransferase involved in cell wall biosynthesis
MSIRHVAFLGFHTGPGGIGKVMANLMNAMAAGGVHVDVLLSSREAADRALLSPEVNIVELGKARGVRSVPALVRYLRPAGPDALITNKEWANRAAVSARRFLPHPPKLVFRVGTTGSVALARRPLLKRALRRWGMLRSYRMADAVIAVSNGVAKDTVALTGIDDDRVHVIHNPSIPPDLAERAAEAISHPWLSPETVPVVLAVGRLVEPKDFPTLIRAFAQLRSRRPCRLIILGEGGLRGELEGLAKNLGITADVDLPGYAANPYAYMGRASLFVLSSSREGFPNVLAEALATGTPAVATDCPAGPAEILQGGRYGPLVPVGDAGALADAMQATLDNPLPTEVLREAVQDLRADRIAERYLDIIEKAGP